MENVEKRSDMMNDPVGEAGRTGHPAGGLPRDGVGPLRPGLSPYAGVSRLLDHRQGEGGPRGSGAGVWKTDRGGDRRIPGCARPAAVAPSARWVLFDVGSGLHFQYQGIFDTDFDKYTEDAVQLFSQTGITTVFTNLEGFPRTGRPTRRHSSTRVTTSARASSSTANTPTSPPTRSRRR